MSGNLLENGDKNKIYFYPHFLYGKFHLMKLTIWRVVVVLNVCEVLRKIVYFIYTGKMKQTIYLLFSFSCKFPDLNFAPYILYIYSCYETCS